MILCSLISINRYSYPISAYLHKRKGHKEPKDADASNVPHSTMLQDVAVFLSLFLVWEIKERNTMFGGILPIIRNQTLKCETEIDMNCK